MSYSQAQMNSAMAGAQAGDSHQSPAPAQHSATDGSPSSPSNNRAGSVNSRSSADPRSVSPAVAASAPPLHVGPLPAPAAGIRSFIELGTEESDAEFVQGQLDYHWSKCKEEIMVSESSNLTGGERPLHRIARESARCTGCYLLGVLVLVDCLSAGCCPLAVPCSAIARPVWSKHDTCADTQRPHEFALRHHRWLCAVVALCRLVWLLVSVAWRMSSVAWIASAHRM